MAQFTEEEVGKLKALCALMGGAVAAADAVDKVVIDEEKLGDMDIDQLREFATSIGMEGGKKMARKELVAAIMAFASGEAAPEPAAAEKPAAKSAKAPGFAVGDIVAAKWYEDNDWYEAKVIDIDDVKDTGKIKLKFIADNFVQNTKVADIKAK